MRSVITFKVECRAGGILEVTEDRKGLFHGFLSEDSEISPGFCVRLIKAIVEFEDGSVQSFDMKHFKFADKP
jgi:hypothetical protein